jgi:hypothetical protein
MASGLMYSVLDLKTKKVHPIVSCHNTESFDPHLRHIKGFRFFRRDKGKLWYYDIQEFLEQLLQEDSVEGSLL